MSIQALRQSDFTETYAVHAALKHGVRTKLFRKDPPAQKAAERLLKLLESDRSIYGRQSRMIRLMEKGATIDQLRKGLSCSRRTVFRYFIGLEQAGVEIKLEGAAYRVPKGLMQLVGRR